MNLIKVEQCTDEAPILRFLNKDGLMKTLGFEKSKIPRQRTDRHPLFLLRSLRQYESMEDHRGDQYENKIVTLHPETKIPLSYENLNPIFVSCWSTYTSDNLLTSMPWTVFTDAIAAIESHVGQVKKIIDWITPTRSDKEILHAGNWGSLRTDATCHGKIIYYSPDDHEKIYNDTIFKTFNCFFKRCDPHQKEREYRFMSLFENHMHFSPEMYCVRLRETHYIKRIYLKKNALNKEELSLIDSYYGHLIQLIE